MTLSTHTTTCVITRDRLSFSFWQRQPTTRTTKAPTPDNYMKTPPEEEKRRGERERERPWRQAAAKRIFWRKDEGGEEEKFKAMAVLVVTNSPRTSNHGNTRGTNGRITRPETRECLVLYNFQLFWYLTWFNPTEIPKDGLLNTRTRESCGEGLRTRHTSRPEERNRKENVDNNPRKK